MLAVLGFILTGICFGVFAYTFENSVVRKTKLKLTSFSYAYYSLALAMITWGIAAAIGGAEVLAASVTIGNAFLLLGTIYMLDIWLGPKNRAWLWLAVIIAAGLLYARTAQYPPTPFMRDGVLIFDTHIVAAAGLAAIFALIWLPVNLKVAKQVTHKIGQDSIASIYSSIYIAATVSALIFIAARRTITVILSFAAIGVCFAMLVQSNMLIAKMSKEKHHGK